MYKKENSIVFHNGEFINANDVLINPYSQSLHYGNGIFEGIRSYKTVNGARIFKAQEHYERLCYGAKAMHIPVNYSVEELVDITYRLLKKNNFEDAYIRPLVTTGADMSLLSSKESFLTIQCWEWGKYMGDKLLKVKTSQYQRPNPKSCIVDAKVTGHYTNSILATNEAKNAGYDEALLLDMNGYVAECSGANVFIEKDNVLFTPPKGNIMPGITRQTVIDICKEEGIEVVEKYFTLDELKKADNAFFTGTAAEVVGLQSIDDYQFPKKWETTHGYNLMHLYKNEVLETRKTNAPI
ncbi:branched-chain amino acid transaminase [uncultured Winogradskyella sp.]|uniref:branched-chain amino acid transaminase n=1 Tax=uncultured Winogradskyella sp. TaxID=395353 RepID=UPI002609BFD6|nr:branched-chain amino acid transaminase [uncultured Winogradskyella sp.]